MAKGGIIDREKIYQDIAEDLGIEPEEVEKAVRFQFKYVQHVMQKGKFESVRLPYFGIFKVKQKRLKNMKKYNE